MLKDRIQHARVMATHWHRNQMRKYTGEPYVTHLSEVVSFVSTVPHTEAMICAAWLHDIVEDTGATFELIERSFGDTVAELVEMLTDVSKPEDGNRKVRKELDRIHISLASPAAKTIKLADLISNTKSIYEHDKDFAKVYLPEAKALLEVLTEGDQCLYATLHKQLFSV